MNILLVSSQFPNSLEPNRGIFTYQIAKEMARHVNLRVIAPLPSIGPLKFLNGLKKYKVRPDVPRSETIGGIPVYHPVYWAVPKAGIFHHISMYGVLEPLMTSIVKDWHIDAVNCHWIFPEGVAVRRICAELKVPVMLTPLGTDLNSYGQFPLRKRIIKRTLQKSDRISVLNREMFAKCLELGGSEGRLVIIPNGVDQTRFTILDKEQARAKTGLTGGSRTILFIGSLVPVKAVDTLLRAFDLLSRKSTTEPLRLIIIGSGYLEDSLKKLAASLGLDGAVRFIGPVGHGDLVHWLNAADCLCLPSLSEGHPNVVMEALACGTPVVASAVGSIPDLVNDASGALCRPGDHADLAAKLDTCLAGDYDREKIRGRVRDFSWDRSARRYVSELHGLVEERRKEGKCLRQALSF